jgi:cytochrome c peroxidase
MSIASRLSAACVPALTLSAALALAGCGGGGTQATDTGLSSGNWTWVLPTGVNTVPPPEMPANNAMSVEKVELGRFLFYERRLSGNGTQSCGDCHLQRLAFTDGRTTAIGSTGEAHPRNAQPLANVAYSTTLTWANFSLRSLEQQMLVPIFGESPVEMGVNDTNQASVIGRIAADSDYQRRFGAAFPGAAAPINWDNTIKAIAAFQRSLLSFNSKYDRAARGETVLSAAEVRGRDLFNSEKAECFHCHGSFNFNDQVLHAGMRSTDIETVFHNTGLYNIDGQGAFPAPNRGIFELSGQAADMGKFRAQTLRNVAVTAPYMHDGSIATLEEVLDFYAAGGRLISSGPLAGDGRANPYKSDLITAINLTTQDKADLVAFLKTLTDDDLLTNPSYANPFTTTP